MASSEVKQSDVLSVNQCFFLDAKRRSGRDCVKKFIEPSLTDQSSKHQQDVNNIVKQYALMGYTAGTFQQMAEQVYADAAAFTDTTQIPDLMTAHNKFADAKEQFIQTVPAAIREQFGHDAMKFYNFVMDSKNEAQVKAMFNIQNMPAPSVEQLAEGNEKKE